MENEFLNILFSRSVWHTCWMWYLGSQIQNWLDPQGYAKKLPLKTSWLTLFLTDFLWGTWIGLLGLKKIKYCLQQLFTVSWMGKWWDISAPPESLGPVSMLLLQTISSFMPHDAENHHCLFFFQHNWTFLSAFTNSVIFQDTMQSANLFKSWYFYLKLCYLFILWEF